MFDPLPFEKIFIAGTELYYKNKVHHIQVKSPEGYIKYEAALDRSGQCIFETYPLREAQLEICYTYNEEGKPMIKVEHYNRKGLTCIIDSTVYTYHRQQVGDTLITFTHVAKSRYKIGSLLNEQNTYYDERFYNKPLIIREAYDRSVQADSPKIYLDKLLRQDYEPGRYYRCSVQGYDEQLNIIQNGQEYKASPSDLQGKFQAYFHPIPTLQYFEDGASFEEPVSADNSIGVCGTGMATMQQGRNTQAYGFDTLSNGLYSAYVLKSKGRTIQTVYKIQYSFFP